MTLKARVLEYMVRTRVYPARDSFTMIMSLSTCRHELPTDSHIWPAYLATFHVLIARSLTTTTTTACNEPLSPATIGRP